MVEHRTLNLYELQQRRIRSAGRGDYGRNDYGRNEYPRNDFLRDMGARGLQISTTADMLGELVSNSKK